MEKNPEGAFKWIVGILAKHKIPFQVEGGLAARAYGAERELADKESEAEENPAYECRIILVFLEKLFAEGSANHFS